MASEGSEGVEGSLKRLRRPSRSNTKSVNVPPVSTPTRMTCLLANCHPAPTFIRRANGIQNKLNSITIFKCRGIFNDRFSGTHCFHYRDGECRETARPTSFAHTFGRVVLLHLNRPPRSRAGRRKPQLTSLFRHQRAFSAVYLDPVLVLARFNN